MGRAAATKATILLGTVLIPQASWIEEPNEAALRASDREVPGGQGPLRTGRR